MKNTPTHKAGRLVALLIETPETCASVLNKATLSLPENVFLSAHDIVAPGNTPIAQRPSSCSTAYDLTTFEKIPFTKDLLSKREHLGSSWNSLPLADWAQWLKKQVTTHKPRLSADLVHRGVLAQDPDCTGWPAVDGSDRLRPDTELGQNLLRLKRDTDADLCVTFVFTAPTRSAHERLGLKPFWAHNVDSMIRLQGWAKRFTWEGEIVCTRML